MLYRPAAMYTSTSPRDAMFCIHCGAPNPEGASFCSSCGKNIGAPANPAVAAEAAQRVVSSAEKSSGNTTVQSAPPISLPTQATPQPTAQAIPQAMPQLQYQPAATGKGKPVLWILAGFGACLLIVIAMAIGFRLNQASPGTARGNAVTDTTPTAAPATYTAPAPASENTPAPAPDNTPAPTADNTPAPASAPVQAPAAPAPAPQNPIVGDWKATTFIGSTISLHLGADGRFILNPGSDEGVYSYSSGDGTLRLQSNSFFSEGIMVWSCQVSGDSLSCVDPNGGGHVYNRVR